MGQGMALITPEPEKVLAEAAKAGIEAKIAGEIVGEPKISIVSKGTERPGQILEFDVE